MRQRLAIAAALLKAPDLLILDEPTNGLDPAGIRDIRDLIRGLGESGVTVLLSSHNLAEVQQVCHSVSIIGNGRLIASGAVEDLVGDDTLSVVRVWVADPDAAIRSPPAGPLPRHPRRGPPRRRGGRAPRRTSRGCSPSKGLYVRGLTPVRADLESVFLQLTRDAGLGEPARGTRHEAPLASSSTASARAARSRSCCCSPRPCTVLLASTALWDTRPVSAAEQARAQAQAERVADDPRLQNDLVGCRANPRTFFGPDIDSRPVRGVPGAARGGLPATRDPRPASGAGAR